MPPGGRREGAGRKPGGVNKMSAAARERAALTGELPHELLLRVSRGENIDGHKPTFQDRVDAAKAAAPYFAPRMSTIDASVVSGSGSLESMSNAELEAIVRGER